MNQPDRFSVTRSLILRAAGRAPPSLSERLAEEWLADVTARCGVLSQLRFALGCSWATSVISRELGDPVRAAAAATGNKAAMDYVGSAPSFFSRRTMTVLLIAGLHALVIYGLATGMARTVLTSIPGRIDITLLPRPAPRTETLPPLGPKLMRFRREIPLPPPQVFWQPPAQDRVVDTLPPRTYVPPRVNPVDRVVGGPGAGFPNTGDFYPEASRRLGERGITTVNVCVDGTGRLSGMPTIEESSGSSRLDEGALKLAKAGSGRYRATTENGRPVSACYAFRVRFELRN